MSVLLGDCREILPTLEPESLHACLCDPPYDLTTAGRWGDAETPPAEGVFRRTSGGFMGKQWDATGVAFNPETWKAVRRVLKPGAWLAAMGSDRTHHRLMVAIEDAGFEIRHCLCHCYASGFPKSLDVSKAIDAHLGAEREVVGANPTWREAKRENRIFEPVRGDGASVLTAPATLEAAAWEGWGTAMKPAVEFIVLARVPLSEPNVAANVLKHGTGGINIDACRVGANGQRLWAHPRGMGYRGGEDKGTCPSVQSAIGRYPSTLLLSHSPLCTEDACHESSCPVALLDEQAGERTSGRLPAGTVRGQRPAVVAFGKDEPGRVVTGDWKANTGPASRFFATFAAEPPPLIFAPKPSRSERDAGLGGLPLAPAGVLYASGRGFSEHDPYAEIRARNAHPTVKSTALFRYLARLLCPPGGIILDPFTGSGTTGVAAALDGFRFTGIEREEEYAEIARTRIAHAARQAERGRPLLAKTRTLRKTAEGQGSLFNTAPEEP